MRRYAILLLSLLLAASCDQWPAGEPRVVVFHTEDAVTRTVFTEPEGDLYPVLWTGEEEGVLISLNADTPREAPVQAAEDGRTAWFSAEFTPDGSGTSTFYLLSPASAYRGIADGEWDFEVPAVQTPTATSVDPAAMVLTAVSQTVEGLPDEISVRFIHRTAYGCFSLTGLGPDIRSVSLGFEEGDTLTIKTPSPSGIWFGTKPRDLSGRTVNFRVRTGAGTCSRTVTFPEGRVLEAGKIAQFTVDMTAAAFEPDSRSIRILAIGNSFSVDAMQYLYGYLRQAGYEEISLGNLFIGGCTLATHAANARNNQDAYTYYTNTTGSWGERAGGNIVRALQSQEWDYVSLQQASGSSGMQDTFEPHLGILVDTVRRYCPGARLMWHQTWAYEADSNHSEFAKYGCVQIRMYNAIVDAVRQQVLTRGDFAFVIPCGTAVQNLRTSFIGDTVTRDGYHMSHDLGRVTTALMWLKQITGCPLGMIEAKPEGYSMNLDARHAAAIKDAVDKAYARPLEVTPSDDPPERLAHESDPALLQALADAGYDPSAYIEMPYGITTYAFYNSTSSITFFARANGRTDSNLDEFAATPLFSQEDIPAGSVLVLKDGYQYRPEFWKRLSTTNAGSLRPDNVKGPSVVQVDESWWKDKAYRAFNLAKKGNPHLTDAEMKELRSCFAIFIPK